MENTFQLLHKLDAQRLLKVSVATFRYGQQAAGLMGATVDGGQEVEGKGIGGLQIIQLPS